MPGGPRDSSKTRVKPVFERLRLRTDDWVRVLLSLGAHGSRDVPSESLDLAFQSGSWAEDERGLRPPVSLLSWLIRNLAPPVGATTVNRERQQLLSGNPTTIADALVLLRTKNDDRGWWVFEGPTYPDVFIETPDAIIVAEGKRTEPGPTTHTTWMPERHQIWRHMDAAWEIRGRRRVFGLFIVEDSASDPGVPPVWRRAAEEAVSEAALAGSFPHRSAVERQAIVQGFCGVTTWRAVCQRFDIDFGALPDKLPDSAPNNGLQPAPEAQS